MKLRIEEEIQPVEEAKRPKIKKAKIRRKKKTQVDEDMIRSENLAVDKLEMTDNFKQFSEMKIQCLDCECFGTLRKVGDQVVLFTEEVLSTRSIHTQEADLKKEKTWKEKRTGTLFKGQRE
ncbi:Oidioi.mRNA.OKI2018_I69.PAR.g9566.t1.cds [Oikopleura dioica]|uniref:Oidioi.mRNA.OKI2018_I69.PAR.g9566.t1.cds n=1 Tax=Oikopleura dioica TaxID=34765 RepID=A0ABN7RL97_OIKDI|nr:Oidioi.mRNA.OKI2018_I69.PAR.g9566.t1.cds [Oikopleura dioica]